MPNISVLSSNVKGDISSCKIENQMFRIRRDSVVSLVEYHDYISYDVCNESVLYEYSVPEFTVFSRLCFISLMIAFSLIVFVCFIPKIEDSL